MLREYPIRSFKRGISQRSEHQSKYCLSTKTDRCFLAAIQHASHIYRAGCCQARCRLCPARDHGLHLKAPRNNYLPPCDMPSTAYLGGLLHVRLKLSNFSDGGFTSLGGSMRAACARPAWQHTVLMKRLYSNQTKNSSPSGKVRISPACRTVLSSSSQHTHTSLASNFSNNTLSTLPQAPRTFLTIATLTPSKVGKPSIAICNRCIPYLNNNLDRECRTPEASEKHANPLRRVRVRRGPWSSGQEVHQM